MSTDSSRASRQLPTNPNLRHLKDQAKDLLKSGGADSLTNAQFEVAKSYGFASWPKLKAHIDSLEEAGQLKAAIDANDLDRVKAMMTRNPELHRAPLGYGKDGPLTWVAECRVPREAPGPVRLAMAKWMIDNGSDIHQGGDGPLMRAAVADRAAMMELLVENGADVNAIWHGFFPIIFGPCEDLDPSALKWLLDRGANPNPAVKDSALDYLLGTYIRGQDELNECIDLLVAAGGTTRFNGPGVLDLVRGRLDLVAQALDEDPTLVHRRYPDLEFGNTAARMLLLKGATLLHVAAEFDNLAAATLLLDRGADVNARADVDERGVGGQTPIFHAATQREDAGLEVVRLLIERGADLTVRAKLPGYYERPDEIVECTPLEYSILFPGDDNETVALLKKHMT